MATLRQVTTRFKFETDKRGLSELREGINGAKRALLGMASALALGAIGGALVKAGNDLQRAAILARQFTDEVVRLDSGAIKLTGQLAEAWERVQAAIPGQETMTEFLNAFVKFRQSFKDAPLENFETLFEAAGALARISGKPISETFDALHQAIISGDFDALVAFLPEFDQMDANMQSFVKSLIEVDPSNVQTVGQRLSFILSLLRLANPELLKTADLMVETTAEGQWDKLLDGIKRVTEELSGPFHRAMVQMLKPVNAFFDAWIKGGTTIRSFADAFKETIGVQIPDAILRALEGTRGFLDEPTPADIEERREFGRRLRREHGVGGSRGEGLFGDHFSRTRATRDFRGLPGGGFTDPGGIAGFGRLPNFEGQVGTLFSREDVRELGEIIGGVIRQGTAFDPRTVRPQLTFAPTVNVDNGGGPDLTTRVISLLESMWDTALDQFNEQEVPE